MDFIQLVDFVNKKLKLVQSHIDNSRKQKSQSQSLTWNTICTGICKTMLLHGSGITLPILLAEIEAADGDKDRANVYGKTNLCRVPSNIHNSRSVFDVPFELYIQSAINKPGHFSWIWELEKDPYYDDHKQSSLCATIKMYANMRYWELLENKTLGSFFKHNRRIRLIEVQTSILEFGNNSNGSANENKLILPSAKIIFLVEAIQSSSCQITLDKNAIKKRRHNSSKPENIYQPIANLENDSSNPKLDENFLLDAFGARWDQDMKRFIQSDQKDKPILRCTQFWFRVGSIENDIIEVTNDNWTESGVNTVYSVLPHTTLYQNKPNNKLTRKTKRIYGDFLDEFGGIYHISLSLWGSDIKLADLISEGGYLGVWKATVSDQISGSAEKRREINLELSSESILFFQHLDSMATALQSENSVIEKKDFPNRIMIKDLISSMNNVTLVGKVVKVSRNIPKIKHEGGVSPRRVVRISDETGCIDITFWNDMSFQIAKLLPFQIVVISGLSVLFENTKLLANASLEQKSRLFVVNTLSGFISSSGLRNTTYIKHASTRTMSYINAYIRDIRPRNRHIQQDSFLRSAFISAIHEDCLTRIKVDPDILQNAFLLCETCSNNSVAPADLKYAFEIEFCVDDGSACEWMLCTYDAANTILGMSPKTLEHSDDSHILKTLAPVIGKEFVMCISTLISSPSTEGCKYRIDCALAYQNINSSIKRLISK